MSAILTQIPETLHSHTEERVLQAQKRVTLSSSHCDDICMEKRMRGVEKGQEEKVGGWRGPAENKPGGEAPGGAPLAVLSPYTNYYTSSQQRPPSTMTDPALQIPEVIQSSTVRRNPSPKHDLNPATAASEKRPVVAGPASDAGSISSGIVDPSRMIRPVRRRQTLPPMPDLRFEQSYLASIKDADTWGRVAWITIRDQVRLLPLPR